MVWVSTAVLAAAALWLAAAIALDRLGRRSPEPGKFGAVVVLGCKVSADGTPSRHLARRVEKAVDLWRQGWAPVVVLTGGGEPSEASVAAHWALGLGLPRSALVLEERSRSTEENARFARDLISTDRVLLVTDSYHAPRARMLFRCHFAEVDTVGVLAAPAARLENALREVLALAWWGARLALASTSTAGR